MKRRYIVDKAALDVINIGTADGYYHTNQEDQLHFDNLNFLSLLLTDNDAELIRKKGIKITIEVVTKPTLFSNPAYEKIRIEVKKFGLKNVDGKGSKVAIADTGCNVSLVPCDFTVNYGTGDAGVNGNNAHGTECMSIVKSSIGLANGCESHFIKIFNDFGGLAETAVLAAVNYCISHSIDVMNMSWDFYTENIQTYINSLLAANCIPVAASGNAASLGPIASPAGLNGVVAVNSLREDGTPGFFSGQIVSPMVKGIDFSCAGYGSEVILPGSGTIPNFGTSFSSPFFCGVFALYKQELGITDNKRVLQQIKNKAIKRSDPVIYGQYGELSS